jgi:hypothetical protein
MANLTHQPDAKWEDPIDEPLRQQCYAIIDGLPETIPEDKLPCLVGVIDGWLKVYVVDGDKVKLYQDLDYVDAGNHERFNFIPKNEIWLDDRIDLYDHRFNLYHECLERRLMADHGLSYLAAHKRANGSELQLRKADADSVPEPALFGPLLERSSIKSLLSQEYCPVCHGPTKSDGIYTWCTQSPCEWNERKPTVEGNIKEQSTKLERSSILTKSLMATPTCPSCGTGTLTDGVVTWCKSRCGWEEDRASPSLIGQAAGLDQLMDGSKSKGNLPEGQKIGKHVAARTLGHYGGKKGGPARDRALGGKEKKRIARMGAKARWRKKGKRKSGSKALGLPLAPQIGH